MSFLDVENGLYADSVAVEEGKDTGRFTDFLVNVSRPARLFGYDPDDNSTVLGDSGGSPW
jgi:hypothetical protein